MLLEMIERGSDFGVPSGCGCRGECKCMDPFCYCDGSTRCDADWW